MKIWKRIILGFISVIVIMIIVDANALRNNIQIISDVNHLEHSRRIEFTESNKTAYLIQYVESNLRELFLEVDSGERHEEIVLARENINSNIASLSQSISNLRKATQAGYSLSIDEDEQNGELEELVLLDSLDVYHSDFVYNVNLILELLDSNELEQAEDDFEINLEPDSRKMQALVSVIVDDAEEEVSWAINQLNVKVDKSIKLGIYLTILSILLSLAIGLYISKSISEPLYKLISGTREIGKGNLETTVNLKTKGELQMLAHSFNEMASELKDRMNAINKLNEELEESNHAKDKYFSIIAHDLKNPFNAILGFTDLLVDQYPDFSEEERHTMILELNKSSKVVYDLLENLLTWSRSQSGKIELKPQELKLSPIVEKGILFYGGNADRKKISIINHVSDELTVFADKFTLSVIINNILNNAIKFTHDGGKVIISAYRMNKQVEICIKDTGIGMSQTVVDSLLQSKRIGSTPGTKNEKGTGLGMTLIKDFVSKNNGILAIDSIPGKGTSFKITLSTHQTELYSILSK